MNIPSWLVTCNTTCNMHTRLLAWNAKWPLISCSLSHKKKSKNLQKRAPFWKSKLGGDPKSQAYTTVKYWPAWLSCSIYVQHKKVAGIFPRQFWIGNLWFVWFFLVFFFHLTGGSKMFFSRILVVFSAGGRFSPMFWPPAVCLLNCFPWSPAFYLWPVAPWHGRCPSPLLRDQKVTRRPLGRGIRGSASGATIPAGGKKKSPHNGLRNFEGHRAQHQMLLGKGEVEGWIFWGASFLSLDF